MNCIVCGWEMQYFITCAVLASVCINYHHVSVCPSVISWCSIEMAKRMIMQTMLHDSPRTVVSWCQKSRQNSNGVTPNGGAKCRWDRLNAGVVAENWRLWMRSSVATLSHWSSTQFVCSIVQVCQQQLILVVCYFDMHYLHSTLHWPLLSMRILFISQVVCCFIVWCILQTSVLTLPAFCSCILVMIIIIIMCVY